MDCGLRRFPLHFLEVDKYDSLRRLRIKHVSRLRFDVLVEDLIFPLKASRNFMDSPPEHWTPLTGPSNWFRLHHPPQWESEERQGTLAVRPTDSDALVAINSVWIDAERTGALPGLQDIVSQFPETRNVTSHQDHNFGSEECVQGEAVLVPTRNWWEKLLAPGHWRSWTMWSFRREKLLLVITLLHAAERDPEFESIVRMMLSSLEICDEPADPPEVFAQRVLRLARSKYPLLDIQLAGEFQLQIESSRLNLGNFYRAYVREPDQMERIVLPALTTAVQVQGWGQNEASPPLEVVRDRLMPMLYSEDLWQSQFPHLVATPWVAGLVVLYVVDEANAYWYVRDELLESWSMSQDDLHQLTIENLQSYFEIDPMEMAVATSEQGEPTMMMPNKPDTYNTARLLSHTFRDRMREAVQGDLIVGAPGRDFFVAVALKAPALLPEVRQQVLNDYRSTDHPLTDRLLLLTADGVSELMDDIQ